MSRMGRLKEAKQAYRDAKAHGKEASAGIKADKQAHPEKYTWAAVREESRRRWEPTSEELMGLAENAKVIYVGQSATELYGRMTFSPVGLKTYVSLNGLVFHEVSQLPEVITRDFAREIASMGHASHDGRWRSPVTGVQYGGCWTLIQLKEPPSAGRPTSPGVKEIEQYLIGEPVATGRLSLAARLRGPA
jgi:hypothetical protein